MSGRSGAVRRRRLVDRARRPGPHPGQEPGPCRAGRTRGRHDPVGAQDRRLPGPAAHRRSGRRARRAGRRTPRRPAPGGSRRGRPSPADPGRTGAAVGPVGRGGPLARAGAAGGATGALASRPRPGTLGAGHPAQPLARTARAGREGRCGPAAGRCGAGRLLGISAVRPGVLCAARDAPAESIECFRECGRRLLARRWTNPALLPWRSLAADALGRLGRRAAAARLALEEQELAERWGVWPARCWSVRQSGSRTIGEEN